MWPSPLRLSTRGRLQSSWSDSSSERTQHSFARAGEGRGAPDRSPSKVKHVCASAPPQTTTMKIVARQKRSMFIATVGGGTLAIVAGIAGPFFLQIPASFTALLSAWFVIAGAIIVTVGVAARRPDGVALAFDEDGIHWQSPVLRNPRRFISWRDVVAAHVVACSEEDGGSSEGIILCLRDHGSNPMGAQWSERLSQELRERFGKSIPANVVLFQDDRWVWTPSETVREIRERIVSFS